FHEFQPRRRRVEEIADLDPRALAQGRGRNRVLLATFDRNRPRGVAFALPAYDRQTADGADRGQRLAAKAEMLDAEKIVVGELRGAMPLDRERQLLRIHTDAVVGDGDEALTPVLQRHLDARRTRIDRIFDQLFDRRSRPLDDFAGGDAIDEGRRKQADW